MRFGVDDLGFRMYVSRFMVLGFGFKVRGIGFRLWDLRLLAKGLEFEVRVKD